MTFVTALAPPYVQNSQCLSHYRFLVKYWDISTRLYAICFGSKIRLLYCLLASLSALGVSISKHRAESGVLLVAKTYCPSFDHSEVILDGGSALLGSVVSLWLQLQGGEREACNGAELARNAVAHIRASWPAWPNLGDDDCCRVTSYIIPKGELQRVWFARIAPTLFQQEPMPNELHFPVKLASGFSAANEYL